MNLMGLSGLGQGLTGERIQEAFRQTLSVPALSSSVLKFIELLDSGHLVSPQTMQAVSSDPGLAAVLIRAASSPYFAQANGVKDARSALQVLGVRGARGAAQSTILSSASAFINRRSKLEPGRFVAHSLMVSILARYLFEVSRQKLGFKSEWSAEAVATAGTLHDLPWAGFCSVFPAEFDELCVVAALTRKTMPEVFAMQFRYSYRDFMALVFECWRLPQELLQLTSSAFEQEFVLDESPAAYCLQLANQLADKDRFQLIPLNPESDPTELLAQQLELEPQELDAAVKVAAMWTNSAVAGIAA